MSVFQWMNHFLNVISAFCVIGFECGSHWHLSSEMSQLFKKGEKYNGMKNWSYLRIPHSGWETFSLFSTIKAAVYSSSFSDNAAEGFCTVIISSFRTEGHPQPSIHRCRFSKGFLQPKASPMIHIFNAILLRKQRK